MPSPQEPLVSQHRSWLPESIQRVSTGVEIRLIHFHEQTGAPWWAVLMGLGAGLRIMCMPAAVKASAVASNNTAGKQIAWRHISYLIGEPSVASLTPSIAGHGARQKRLAPQMAPGSVNKLWYAAPFVQVRSQLTLMLSRWQLFCADLCSGCIVHESGLASAFV